MNLNITIKKNTPIGLFVLLAMPEMKTYLCCQLTGSRAYGGSDRQWLATLIAGVHPAILAPSPRTGDL